MNGTLDQGNAPPVVEFVTSPNNPDASLREGRVAGAARIHDSAYYWPHYVPITHAREPTGSDVHIYTLSKLTGHAGTRVGWAVVEVRRPADINCLVQVTALVDVIVAAAVAVAVAKCNSSSVAVDIDSNGLIYSDGPRYGLKVRRQIAVCRGSRAHTWGFFFSFRPGQPGSPHLL